MAKSGVKLIGVGVVSTAIGVVLAYQVDNAKGNAASVLITATLILCLAGAALILYGLYKVVAGLFKRN